MASEIVPLITFKAGRCDDAQTGTQGANIKCHTTPGYIYVYIALEDELVHFCWRERSASLHDPGNLDLIMFPGDATFTPYTGRSAATGDATNDTYSPTTGRVYVLKFSSSSSRHLFWLQSKPQHPVGDSSWFSPRDLKLGQIIDLILQGVDVDITQELSQIEQSGSRKENNNNDDEDHDMDDVPSSDQQQMHSSRTGGAGANATGGDVRNEGEESRGGGADGGRAPSSAALNDASALVQNLLASLSGTRPSPTRAQEETSTQSYSLNDLLTPQTCTPILTGASDSYIDSLLSHLPAALVQLEATKSDPPTLCPSSVFEAVPATEAIASLSRAQKLNILVQVLHSPQLAQSLATLTAAIRDGGLPSVATALDIELQAGGWLNGANGVALGGAQAVEAFIEGIRKSVSKHSEDKKTNEGAHESMDMT